MHTLSLSFSHTLSLFLSRFILRERVFFLLWLQLNTNNGNMVEIIHMGCRVRLSERLPTVRLVYCTVFSESTEELHEDASKFSYYSFLLCTTNNMIDDVLSSYSFSNTLVRPHVAVIRVSG